MNIHTSSLNDLEKIGIYKITNLVNNKIYIGSTKKSFVSRFVAHYTKLKSNNHRGYWHLQNAVNQYGINKFEFCIIEICNEENILEREKFWIDYYNTCNNEKGYNLNPNPNLSPMYVEEVKNKMINSLKEGYKSGKIKLNSTTFKKGIIPWNTGKKYSSTEHLKVPKLKRGSRERFSETMKEKQIPINVYNLEGNLIKSYRYIQEIIQDSKNIESEICKNMRLKNLKGRNGYLPTELFNINILKSCRDNTPYKGLIFKYHSAQ